MIDRAPVGWPTHPKRRSCPASSTAAREGPRKRVLPFPGRRIGSCPSRMGFPTDQFFRPLRDLRISVTDRCNFRCPYCMPSEVFGPGHAFLRDPQLMTLGELTRIVRAFCTLGVEKV